MSSSQTDSSLRAALIGFVVVAGSAVLFGSLFLGSSWGVLLVVAAGVGAAAAVTLYHRSPDLTAWKPEIQIGSVFALVIAHLTMIGILGADRLGSEFIIPGLILAPVVIAALSTVVLARVELDLWVFFGVVVAVSLFIAPVVLAVYADTILRPADAIGYDPIWVFLVPPLAIVGTLGGTLFYAMYPEFQKDPSTDSSSS